MHGYRKYQIRTRAGFFWVMPFARFEIKKTCKKSIEAVLFKLGLKNVSSKIFYVTIHNFRYQKH